jgi:hypothetical protein
MHREQRLVSAAPGSEAIGAIEEVSLVDGIQHLGHRALDDLVLKREYAERSFTSISLRDVRAACRQGSIATIVHPSAEILEALLQPLCVCCYRHSVYPGGRCPFQPPIRSVKRIDVYVVQQRREPSLS